MRTRARQDGDQWILNGTKSWISNGGKSTWYTVMAVTDPEKGANGISAFVVHKDDEGFTVGPKERKLGINAPAVRWRGRRRPGRHVGDGGGPACLVSRHAVERSNARRCQLRKAWVSGAAIARTQSSPLIEEQPSARDYARASLSESLAECHSTKMLSFLMNHSARSSSESLANWAMPSKYASRGAPGANRIRNDAGSSASLRKP